MSHEQPTDEQLQTLRDDLFSATTGEILLTTPGERVVLSRCLVEPFRLYGELAAAYYNYKQTESTDPFSAFQNVREAVNRIVNLLVVDAVSDTLRIQGQEFHDLRDDLFRVTMEVVRATPLDKEVVLPAELVRPVRLFSFFAVRNGEGSPVRDEAFWEIRKATDAIIQMVVASEAAAHSRLATKYLNEE